MIAIRETLQEKNKMTMTDQWNPSFFQVIKVPKEKKDTGVHISSWLTNNEH